MIHPKVRRAFERVFGVDGDRLNPETNQGDIENWDSVSHIELILAIEMEFGVQFSTADFSRMTTIDEILFVLAEKGQVNDWKSGSSSPA